jgi:hypothetical protein
MIQAVLILIIGYLGAAITGVSMVQNLKQLGFLGAL